MEHRLQRFTVGRVFCSLWAAWSSLILFMVPVVSELTEHNSRCIPSIPSSGICRPSCQEVAETPHIRGCFVDSFGSNCFTNPASLRSRLPTSLQLNTLSSDREGSLPTGWRRAGVRLCPADRLFLQRHVGASHRAIS